MISVEPHTALSDGSLDADLKHAVNSKVDLLGHEPLHSDRIAPVLSTLPLDKAGITQHDEVFMIFCRLIGIYLFSKSFQGKLLEPFDYYRNLHPGKGRRKSLLQAFNHHLDAPQSWLEGVASIIEDLHSSSLLSASHASPNCLVYSY